MKKYFVLTTTEGCATNLLENAAHRKHYDSLGYSPAQDAESADLILVNTCAYSAEMENRAVRMISEIQDRYGNKEIVLSGCLPKINPARMRQVFRGDVEPTRDATLASAFDRADFRNLSFNHRLLLAARPGYFALERLWGRRFRPLHNIVRSAVVNESYYPLTISTGCLGHCTFCAIKHSKGTLVSRPLTDVIAELDRGLARGFRDFWLLGDDIGCWGQDLGNGMSVAELLRVILGRRERFSLVLNQLDPRFVLRYEAELEPLLGDPRVACVNIPIQSASPTVLRRMRREVETDRLFGLLSRLKARNPALAVKTNLLVGFPGETWGDFARSLRAVFAFDAIVAMKYSRRPHTPAAQFPDQLPEVLKSSRLLLMRLVILCRHLFVAAGALFRPGPFG
jgi:MiaB/RimO family radical SAM methylthiotransferase